MMQCSGVTTEQWNRFITFALFQFACILAGIGLLVVQLDLLKRKLLAAQISEQRAVEGAASGRSDTA